MEVLVTEGRVEPVGAEPGRVHQAPRTRQSATRRELDVVVDPPHVLDARLEAYRHLAGVSTQAIQRDDGSFVLRGQKTWTTDGHWAQMGIALARTSVEATRHGGLTAFAVPMDSPGVEVRPIRTMGGAWEFNETFLDDVSLGPDAVLGEVGKGWAVAMSVASAADPDCPVDAYRCLICAMSAAKA